MAEPSSVTLGFCSVPLQSGTPDFPVSAYLPLSHPPRLHRYHHHHRRWVVEKEDEVDPPLNLAIDP